MIALDIRAARKAFPGHLALDDVDLTVEQGEFLVLLGPSGCGKSTLLRSIAGLEKLSGGQIFIGGRNVTAVAPAARGVAMVFQSYALFPHLNVGANIGFGLTIAKVPRAEIATRVREVATLLKLEQLLPRMPRELSGGQRQRVAIGRALIRQPSVYLFDEPLSNLDASLRTEMRVELARLHQRIGNTIIYVTHDQVEAMTLASRIAVMRNGRVEQVGTPLNLYNRPRNAFVAGFLGQPTASFLPVGVGGCQNGRLLLTLTDGAELEVAVPAGYRVAATGPMSLGLRPKDLVIDAEAPDVRLAVDLVEQLGDATMVYGRDQAGRTLTVEIDGQHNVRSGDSLPLRIKPEFPMLFDSRDFNVLAST